MNHHLRRPLTHSKLAGALIGMFSLLGACSDAGPSTDSQTHWLQPCQDNAACGDEGLSCICGICTAPCTDNAACANTPTPTSCFADNTSTTNVICGGLGKAKNICLPECLEDKDCDAGQRCVQAACITAAALPKTFACGAISCTAGEQSCHSVSPGMAGPTTISCREIPTACAQTPTCECLQTDSPLDCQELYPGALNTHIALP